MAQATVWGGAVVVMPPVPDLSMPFNLAGLVKTFYAFVMAATLNVLLRKATTKMGDEYNGRPRAKVRKRG